tara:strand:+ start:2677 stop:3069 length:393 start_codon:yes stop_codon:yes gene_type:complete
VSLSSIKKSNKSNELLDYGTIKSSEGGHFSYRIIGPCCRLFDREELPWPCSRIAWRSKEPSWRRIGSRFVADIASRKCPTYSVEILEPGSKPTITVLTLFSQGFSPLMQEWWYSKKPRSKDPSNIFPILD